MLTRCLLVFLFPFQIEAWRGVPTSIPASRWLQVKPIEAFFVRMKHNDTFKREGWGAQTCRRGWPWIGPRGLRSTDSPGSRRCCRRLLGQDQRQRSAPDSFSWRRWCEGDALRTLTLWSRFVCAKWKPLWIVMGDLGLFRLKSEERAALRSNREW